MRNTPKQNTSADDISPNQKLELADKIVATLGNDDAVIAAAAGLVAAEQNFNPFAVAIPSICADATLPATPELQGIVPLVDPDVVGAEVENANSARSLQAPLAAAAAGGAQSVADIVAANGFSNFTAVAADGSQVAVAAGAKAGAGAGAGAAAGAGAGAGAAAGKANAGGKAAAGGANKVQCGN